MIAFQKAVKSRSKLRMAIAGPSGSGKTYTALAIGSALTGAGRVAVVDTEHGSASKYADVFDFDVLELAAPFHPDRFVEALAAAAQAGYAVVVLDSLSHAWNGPGGLLEIVDQIAARMKTSNSFAAWKDATPIQNRLIEALLSAPVHVIATMRSKQEYVLEAVERNGRTTQVPKKVGMAPVQRDSFEYEFDVFSEMDMDHNLIVAKTRCSALTDVVVNKPGKEIAETLAKWLSDGAEPEPPSAPATTGNGAAAGMASIEQIDLICKMVGSHVVTNAERKKIMGAVAKGMSSDRAHEAIEWLKTEIPARKAIEAEDAAEQAEEVGA